MKQRLFLLIVALRLKVYSFQKRASEEVMICGFGAMSPDQQTSGPDCSKSGYRGYYTAARRYEFYFTNERGE